MTASKNTNQQVLESSSKGPHGRIGDPAQKPGKMAGTRMGVLDDWREGGAKRTGENSGVGKRLRDGR
jgi:hypothetical protein